MKKIIEELYKYTPSALTGKLTYCDCGCCKEIDFKGLEADREQVDFEVIGRYADKAITTIGTVEDYKYYLPRIAEMIVADQMRTGISFCFLSKLELAKFWNWKSPLKEIILKFLEELIIFNKENRVFENDEIMNINKLLNYEKNHPHP